MSEYVKRGLLEEGGGGGVDGEEEGSYWAKVSLVSYRGIGPKISRVAKRRTVKKNYYLAS